MVTMLATSQQTRTEVYLINAATLKSTEKETPAKPQQPVHLLSSSALPSWTSSSSSEVQLPYNSRLCLSTYCSFPCETSQEDKFQGEIALLRLEVDGCNFLICRFHSKELLKLMCALLCTSSFCRGPPKNCGLNVFCLLWFSD